MSKKSKKIIVPTGDVVVISPNVASVITACHQVSLYFADVEAAAVQFGGPEGRKVHHDPKIKMLARVVFDPEFALTLRDMLNKAIETYTKNFGPLRQQQGKP
jgi:hypothetical protein